MKGIDLVESDQFFHDDQDDMTSIKYGQSQTQKHSKQQVLQVNSLKSVKKKKFKKQRKYQLSNI